jgi:uncharacterized membrane protein YebE (DUF533 family)
MVTRAEVDMDVEYLLGSLLRNVVSTRGGRKKTKGTMRYVLGGAGGAGKALLLGGVAYALLESLTKGMGTGSGSVAPGPLAGPGSGSAASAAGGVVPPPIPSAHGTSPRAAGPSVPPPIPGSAALPATGPTGGVPPEVLRVIRLTISAAQADGVLTAAEQRAILSQARPAGAEAAIAPDLLRRTPPAEILAGVTDPRQREQLYTIAFAIVRADEHVTPDEREYLDEVARALQLDAAAVASLESRAAQGIDREAGP